MAKFNPNTWWARIVCVDVLRSVLAFALLIFQFACIAEADENFDRCLSEDAWCDFSGLNDEQKQQVFQQADQSHLESCLAGKRCNEARLDARTLDRVRAAVRRINFETCLSGSGPCRYDSLDVEELAQVIESDRARNLDRCYSGVTACNENWLSLAQRDEARRRYVERNFNSCMETFGTLLPCNPQDLTPEQGVHYHQRLLDRNYFACMLGLIGCDTDLLSDEQRRAVSAKHQSVFSPAAN